MKKIAQIDSYIAYQKNTDKSVLTLSSYRSDLLQFSIWFQKINHEKMKLNKITPTDLRQYKSYLLERNFKPQTINRRLLSLKYFLEWGWDTKRIKYRFPIPKTVKQAVSMPKWLDKKEQNALLRYLERYASNRDRCIVVILLNTGVRVQELCSLQWQDVTLSERKGKIIIKSGKGNKYREVPLNKDARESFYLLDYKEKAGDETNVFIGQRGILSPRGIQLMFKRVLGNTDLCSITPHQLRHTFCKNLVDAGVSLEKVAALAGHERLDTTKLYCHPSFDDLSEAVEKIGEIE